jgi:hypothetical protein
MPASPRDEVTASCDEPHQVFGPPSAVYVPGCEADDDVGADCDADAGVDEVGDTDAVGLPAVGAAEVDGLVVRVLVGEVLGAAAVLVSGGGAPAPVPCPGEDVVQPATSVTPTTAVAKAPTAARSAPVVLRSAQ